ncbi:Hexokinase [Sphaceloma murrayae]|uniref:Phosphotransferase n=1 Tax=Sphaceloma murrayae TaxID=2082308 RepID=A0A2K1QU22_9PEZI|nr:Hexokinase [Sphaceloma murrayae]
MRQGSPSSKNNHGIEQEIARLEQLFEISSEKLKEVTRHFIEELQDGLASRDQNIPMNETWVQGFPSGKETGSFLTIDLGGTNIRICWITLTGQRGGHKIEQHSYQLPDEIKTGTADKLWDFIASSLQEFIKAQSLEGTKEKPLPLSFTFSYPLTQSSIDHGTLQTWTKGWDVKGVEGEDVGRQLGDALQAKSLPVKVIAIVNDTTGAMIASAYNDPATIIGAIFGTGCNAAYMEKLSRIPKLGGHSVAKHLPPDTPMAINCEYGAFDNALKVLPRTKYDEQIDDNSPRPGEQRFEKLSAGLYLGEIFRLVVLDLHGERGFFGPRDLASQTIARTPYALDTAVLSGLEDDRSASLSESRDRLKRDFGLDVDDNEMVCLQRLAVAIATRGARLCACGVAAICTMTGTKEGNVAADGSVANKHPKFKERWAQALGEILEWKDGEQPIKMTSAEDGSGVGAAVIAAMTLAKR